jgi:hypothetical protein
MEYDIVYRKYDAGGLRGEVAVTSFKALPKHMIIGVEETMGGKKGGGGMLSTWFHTG